MSRPHYKLDSWKLAIELTVTIYHVTKKFPQDEKYALSTQMKRAVVSVASNIAEGAARGTNKEFKHFISIANGSLSELETQLIIAQKLGFVDCVDAILDKCSVVKRKLIGLSKSFA